MNDEQGNSVHRSSLEAYAAIMKPRSRAPLYVLVAALIALGAYVGTLIGNAWNGYLCMRSNDVWTGDRCEQRKPPDPPVQQFKIEFPPIIPDDVPEPPSPPPASSGLPT
jgi:hypothetical protein